MGQKGHRIYQRDRQMQELNEDQGEELETDKEVCQKCGSNSYIPTPTNIGQVSTVEDPYVEWVCCDGCFKWYHAPCVGLSAD